VVQTASGAQSPLAKYIINKGQVNSKKILKSINKIFFKNASFFFAGKKISFTRKLIGALKITGRHS